MPTWTTLRGYDDLAKDPPSTQVEQNVLDFFRWAFLEAGGFSNVAVASPGTPDPYGLSDLFPVQKGGVADGRVWQARKPDWVWETGLENPATPAVCGGVYVNGVYHPTASTTGAYAHHLDFPGGRVVFDSPVPTASLVQAAYAYRWVGMFDASVPWFRPVVLDGFLTEEANRDKGGVLSVLDDYRVQTPLVVVEAAMAQRLRPRQLGDRSHWVDQVVLFHVVAATKADRDRVANAIVQQQNDTVYLYDTDARRLAGDFDLDWRGSPLPGAKTYPQLVDAAGYRSKHLYFTSMNPQDVSSRLPLFRGVVRATVTCDFA